MHDAIKAFSLVFSALFPIVDPLSASPIFLALTRSVLPATRRELTWRVTLNSFALMAGSYFLGSHLLAFFGVSLPAVQVGGGLIVCAFGWNLLMEKDGEKNATPEAVESDDIFRKVFYPLTLPLTIGPGSISVAITVGANVGHTYGVHIWIMVAAVLAMGLVAASIFFCYRFADWLVRALGETGTTVVIRLSAFLLLWRSDCLERGRRPARIRAASAKVGPRIWQGRLPRRPNISVLAVLFQCRSRRWKEKRDDVEVVPTVY